MEDRCVVCGEIIPEGGIVCVNCRKKAETQVAKPHTEETKEISTVDRLLMDRLYDKCVEAFKNQSAKADSGKPILSYVPKEIIYEIEKVRSFGVRKYKEPDNWKKVELERYHEALLRHTLAIWDDVGAKDSESGLLHLSHMATNIAFILELMKDKE